MIAHHEHGAQQPAERLGRHGLRGRGGNLCQPAGKGLRTGGPNLQAYRKEEGSVQAPGTPPRGCAGLLHLLMEQVCRGGGSVPMPNAEAGLIWRGPTHLFGKQAPQSRLQARYLADTNEEGLGFTKC
eukprot:scaffold209352_cov28-Tisochrysis_lutea.AAC.3